MNNSHEVAGAYQVVDRLLALRDLLRAEPHTWEQICKRLADFYSDDENGRRKLRRDLQYLDHWGYHKTYQRDAKTYALSIVRTEHDWNEDELIALAALRESFVEGTPYANVIQSLLEKMARGLNDPQRKTFALKPALTIRFEAAEEQSSAAATRQKLEDVLRQHQRVRFQYKPSDRPKVIYHPDDEPIELVFEDGHYYLWAYCYKMGKIFRFRVDMILPDSVEILPKRAEGRWKPQLSYFQYWLSPKIAERGVSPRFPDMDFDTDKTGRGGVIVTAGAYSDFDAIQGILRYGEQAEILGPEPLREKMKRVVEKMAVLYSHVVG